MKKIYLFTVLIFFACSKDEEQEVQTLKQYLLSTVFYQSDTAQNGNNPYDYEIYYQFNFTSEAYKYTTFSELTSIAHPGNYPWNTCYKTFSRLKPGLLIMENDDRIIWEWSDDNSYKIEFTRSGDNIAAKYIYPSGSDTIIMKPSSITNLNEKKAERINGECY